MTARRIGWLCAAVAAIPLSLAAGWCWNNGCEPLYVAASRVSIPLAMTNSAPGRFSIPSPEDSLLSPEVVAAASDLLHERGISLPAESRFDSDVDYLLERLDARGNREGERIEVELTYRTPDAERAIPVLTAVVEAGVRALQSLEPETIDPGYDTLAPEKIRLESALAAAQTHITELEQRFAGDDADLFVPEKTAHTIRELADSLDRVRAQRIEAEDQLALASRDIRSGVALEQILLSLSKAGARHETEGADTETSRDELRQIEKALEAAAGVYGRNHPHMVSLRTQLDDVRHKLAEEAGILSPSPGQPGTLKLGELQNGRPTVAAQLLKRLEEKLHEATAAEQAIEREIEREQTEASERQLIKAGLAAARQEFVFLQSEHGRVCREIVAERHVAQDRCVFVSEAPMLLSETIAPPLTRHLLWSGVVGVVISGGLLRQFLKSPLIRSAPDALSRQMTSVERYRSRQEDNLARLRRLKPVA